MRWRMTRGRPRPTGWCVWNRSAATVSPVGIALSVRRVVLLVRLRRHGLQGRLVRRRIGLLLRVHDAALDGIRAGFARVSLVLHLLHFGLEDPQGLADAARQSGMMEAE